MARSAAGPRLRLAEERPAEPKASPPGEGAERPSATSFGEQLLALTTSIAEATSIAEVTRSLLEHSVSVLRADEAALWMQRQDSGAIELLGGAGRAGRGEAARRSSVMVAPRAPLQDALGTGEPVWIEDCAALLARYPELAAESCAPSIEIALICVPLQTAGRVIGALEVRFDRARAQDRDELRFLLIATRHAALALERARLDEEATRARADAEQARADAEQARTIAEQAIRLRDDFLGIAGHELKTPLTVLKLGLQSVAKHLGDNPTVAKRLSACELQVARLSRLSGELLDVSQINAHRLHLDLDWMDLDPLVHEVAARMGDDLTRAGCVLSLAVHGPVVGRWDRTRLDQVMANLLSNALRYSKGKPIEVSLTATEEGARLSVRDHGIGVAPADQARIFERFERAVSARHYGGLGLGLFIVRRIVESLGGRIELTSELGRGSTFVVHLPHNPPEGAAT